MYQPAPGEEAAGVGGGARIQSEQASYNLTQVHITQSMYPHAPIASTSLEFCSR